MALPFYEPPSRKTSAEIIREARAAIRGDSHVVDGGGFIPTFVKPVQTQRPFTPKERERIFFGKNKSNRPPSSFSLRYLQNQVDLTSPPSTANGEFSICKSAYPQKNFKKQRSNSISSLGDDKHQHHNAGAGGPLSKIKLPSLEPFKLFAKKTLPKSGFSLDNLPEERDDTTEEEENSNTRRKAFSSPQERTDFSITHHETGDFHRTDLISPFGRPSQQQSNMSRCVLLGPQNLTKLFDNQQIVENSEMLFVKSGYFHVDTNKEEHINEQREEETLDSILEKLCNNSGKKNNEFVVMELLGKLYNTLETESSSVSNSKMKIRILKCLYKYVECQNENLLLAIARILLLIRVTGNNLTGVCKLIFKVSKCDKNDYLFLEKNMLDLFVDALGRSSPLDDGEACVYGYGSVKFLTMNLKLLKRIVNLGILPLMLLHIKLINNAKQEKFQIPEQTEHALFQLTGALRNLASEADSMREDFEPTVLQLCQTLDLFSSNLDIVSNISRILSALSSNDKFCDKIAEYRSIYKVFIVLFEKYPGNEEITVRLTYTLGNVLAKLDDSRIKFYRETNSVRSVINLWKIYLERTLKSCSLKVDDESENDGNYEDVMIKIIRIIANLAINTDIGKEMNEKYGMQLVDELLKVLISNPFKKNDELMLSVLSTLNNLSYYYSVDYEKDIFYSKQIGIIEAISDYLHSNQEECVTEAIRILGNLSRSKLTRNYVVENSIFSSLVTVLENKEDVVLLKTTIGVFVNLMADNKNRLLFKKENGLSKLINVLSVHGQYDWSLSMLICQVIWNYCIDSINLYDLVTDSEMQQVISILADYLDEERLFGITESDEDLEIYATQEYLVWEEFANVATNLLEKFEHFLDTLEQIGTAYQARGDSFEAAAPPTLKSTSKLGDHARNLNFVTW